MMFVDYLPCSKCDNAETFGMICVKCERCGRRFDEYGNCVNIGDYPAADEEYES